MIRELRKVAPVDQGPRTGPDATKAAGNEMVGCHDDASVCRTGLRQDVKHPCSAGAGGYANTICRVPENPTHPRHGAVTARATPFPGSVREIADIATAHRQRHHAGGGEAGVHLEQEGRGALHRALASELQHMIFRMPQLRP
jgi:hypothetical protein